MKSHHNWPFGHDVRLSIDPLPPVPQLQRRLRVRDRIGRLGVWALVLAMAALSFFATEVLLDHTPSGVIQAKN